MQYSFYEYQWDRLNLLLAFEALIDERHVGRAARQVGLSQPAFSNAIARLRTRLGDPLFVRTAQGMMPTPRADQLAGPIRSALAQLRQTFEAPHSFDPSVSAHRFRIGLSDDVELRLVPLLARSMLSGELQMQTRRLDWLFTVPESELRNGTLDLAIGYFPDARHLAPGLVMESVSEENNVVIARRGHSMWKGELTLDRFTRLDHAAVIYRNQLWGLIDNELAARGLRRASDWRSRIAFLCCTPSRRVTSSHASRNLLFRNSGQPQPEVLPRASWIAAVRPRMVWHRQRDNDTAQVWLRKLIATELGSPKTKHPTQRRKTKNPPAPNHKRRTIASTRP